jgi:hypothetical protein
MSPLTELQVMWHSGVPNVPPHLYSVPDFAESDAPGPRANDTVVFRMFPLTCMPDFAASDAPDPRT